MPRRETCRTACRCLPSPIASTTSGHPEPAGCPSVAPARPGGARAAPGGSARRLPAARRTSHRRSRGRPLPAPVDGGRCPRWEAFQPEDHPHRGGLALRSGRGQPVDHPRPDREGQVVHASLSPTLGQARASNQCTLGRSAREPSRALRAGRTRPAGRLKEPSGSFSEELSASLRETSSEPHARAGSRVPRCRLGLIRAGRMRHPHLLDEPEGAMSVPDGSAISKRNWPISPGSGPQPGKCPPLAKCLVVSPASTPPADRRVMTKHRRLHQARAPPSKAHTRPTDQHFLVGKLPIGGRDIQQPVAEAPSPACLGGRNHLGASQDGTRRHHAHPIWAMIRNRGPYERVGSVPSSSATFEGAHCERRRWMPKT